MDSVKVRRRLWAAAGYLGLLIVAIGVGIFLYFRLSPPKEAISVSPQPIPVLTKTVSADGTCAVLGFDRCAVLQFTRCKNVDAPGRIIITLVSNTTRLLLPEANEREDRKCDRDVKAPLPIPPQTTPGKYHFHFRTTYKINPITTIVQDFDTESFEIQ